MGLAQIGLGHAVRQAVAVAIHMVVPGSIAGGLAGV